MTGLPDEYKLPANVNEALRLMGDGVAVLAVRFLAENLSIRFSRSSPCGDARRHAPRNIRSQAAAGLPGDPVRPITMASIGLQIITQRAFRPNASLDLCLRRNHRRTRAAA